ncbi:MAG: hypothetical protein LBF50_06235 [Azoarcus sp.]|nr:hypothetical protein [Azoarcus sp.]
MRAKEPGFGLEEIAGLLNLSSFRRCRIRRGGREGARGRERILNHEMTR